ncbi:MAG: DeoR family transcriptional regulator [Pseudopedobacter saltans]|uniref:DeoR family transcriptional regulator n=1 Tax=Pseudopedobacter saltans TaxID=151895 RepID=A0A2W5EQ71_9SPHI|nr:MAG: DeoR family transcriptional regulator [Pseudopedobacter saltans]
MLKKEREYFILQQLNIHNKVLVSDLCQAMNVSEDTIRRDLQTLSDNGKLMKVHGGALSNSFGGNQSIKNPIYAQNEKETIARKAVTLVKDGMLILLTGGSTIVEMIRHLPKNLNATFVTPSLTAAMALTTYTNCQVVFIGNTLLNTAKMAYGSEVFQKLADIHADLAFIGTNSVDIEHGLTDTDWEILEVKRAMMKASDKTILLAISEKVNTHQRLTCCKIEDINILITELPTNTNILQPYIQKGITVL